MEVVNTLIDTTRAEGPGKRYLIQHSAGSGKSNSIAWTAHQLASLYDAEGQRLFNSVIVITDRTVLDKQLQDTIYQFEHAQGVVKCITRDIGNQSKSEQLAEALAEQTRIIIVTIQTFPALFDALDKHPKLASGRYAVIADEAHSSQTGSSASKLKQILGSDAPDAEEISAEELDAAVAARAPNERISYYAFTATPKPKTLELFGRPANPALPVSADNKPEAFHLYSMRQAIEEGIYHWEEVAAFAIAFFDPKATASKLSYYCAPAKERFAKRYKLAQESRQHALDFKRTAEQNGDSAGVKKAEAAIKEAGEQVDQLDLFKKNLQSFVRLYEFLSQIIPYEDRELEQLCVYAKHLHPLLRVDRLEQEDVDLGELQLSHYRLSKRAEHQLRLSEEKGDYGLDPASAVGSGKAHDPEKKRLSEIIEALNDIFGAEVSDEDQLQFLTGMAKRISRQEDVMAQVNNHSVEQVMHGLFPKRVLDTVLDAMTDHEKLSLEVLDNETKSRAFALVILKMLTAAGGWGKVIVALRSDLLARRYYVLGLNFRRLRQKT